jgi:hypothetical protein
MTIARFALLLLALLLLAACGPDKSSEEPAAIAPLTLNEGAKWQMDAHTRGSFGRMQDWFAAAGRPADLEAYQDLGRTLTEELQVLIGGCTMVGPDHDQLHLFLTEFMPRVNKLRQAEEFAAAEQVRGELGQLFGEYRAHFE